MQCRGCASDETSTPTWFSWKMTPLKSRLSFVALRSIIIRHLSHDSCCIHQNDTKSGRKSNLFPVSSDSRNPPIHDMTTTQPNDRLHAKNKLHFFSNLIRDDWHSRASISRTPKGILRWALEVFARFDSSSAAKTPHLFTFRCRNLSCGHDWSRRGPQESAFRHHMQFWWDLWRGWWSRPTSLMPRSGVVGGVLYRNGLKKAWKKTDTFLPCPTWKRISWWGYESSWLDSKSLLDVRGWMKCSADFSLYQWFWHRYLLPIVACCATVGVEGTSCKTSGLSSVLATRARLSLDIYASDMEQQG
jgi:hypothetical protein